MYLNTLICRDWCSSLTLRAQSTQNDTELPALHCQCKSGSREQSPFPLLSVCRLVITQTFLRLQPPTLSKFIKKDKKLTKKKIPAAWGFCTFLTPCIREKIGKCPRATERRLGMTDMSGQQILGKRCPKGVHKSLESFPMESLENPVPYSREKN